jgi:hypothetical protein
VRQKETVVYRDDMPKGIIVKLTPEKVILVGTGLNYQEGVDFHERVLPQTRR